MVTQREIAERLGINQATVSLALRGSPEVSKKTVQKVRQAAAEMGYRANPLVSAYMEHLRRSRKTSKGVAIAYVGAQDASQLRADATGLENTNTVATFLGAQERCGELGYRLDYFCLGDYDPKGEALNRIFRARSIPAAILALLGNAGRALELDWDRHSWVGTGFLDLPVEIPRVVPENARMMRQLCGRLGELGYRRFGFLIDPIHDEASQHVLRAAFLEYQDEFFSPAERLPVLVVSRGDTRAIEDFVGRFRPDVIIGGFTSFIDDLRSIGLSPPEDIGFASAYVVAPREERVTGMAFDRWKIGRLLVDLLTPSILRHEVGLPEAAFRILAPGCWNAGMTCAAQR